MKGFIHGHHARLQSRKPRPAGAECECGCGDVASPGRRFVNGHRAPALPIEVRFWAKVEKTDDCWIWRAGTFKNGYGEINQSGKGGSPLYAHRVSWELTRGPIPPGMDVCHTCDAKYPRGDVRYRRCVNPAHLFLGTRSDNMRDMHAKGRAADPSKAKRGEQAGGARLTEEIVTEIRRVYAAKLMTQTELAGALDVSQSLISAILLRRVWAHLPMPPGAPAPP